MRLRAVVLGLLVVGLITGPLAAQFKEVRLEIAGDGMIDSNVSDVFVKTGNRIKWICHGQSNAADWEFRVIWDFEGGHMVNPWQGNKPPGWYTQKQSHDAPDQVRWKPCATDSSGNIDSKPMGPAMDHYRIYKTTFEVRKISDQSGKNDLDPHWAIIP